MKKIAFAILLFLPFPVFAGKDPPSYINRIERTTTVIKSMTANNTTASVQLFKVTGVVNVLGLYGQVTSAIGSNHTNVYFRLEDGTNTPAISKDGVDISNGPVGSTMWRTNGSTQWIVLANGTEASVIEPSVEVSGPTLAPFIITQKSGTDTYLVYRYTTTDTPASGAIRFYIEWIPILPGSKIEAV